MPSDKKKRLSNNMEKDDDEINSTSELKKTRLSSSTDQESIPKVSAKTIPRQSSEHYIATLPFSEFSTHGLQVYPVPSPSPSPEPIVHPPLPPSSSRTAAPTNPASTADASRPGPSKFMLNNYQPAAEGMELRIYNELHQFMKAKMQKDKVPQNPPSVSKDSVPVVQGETLQVGHRPENDSPNGAQQSQKDDMQNKRLGCEMPEATQPSHTPQEEHLEQPPKKEIEDSLPVVQGEILQVGHRPENDSPNGEQRSQKDDTQNKKHSGCEITEETQPSQRSLVSQEQLEQPPGRKIEDSVPVVQEDTLQVRHRPENDSPNGIRHSQKDNIQKMTQATQSTHRPHKEHLEQQPKRKIEASVPVVQEDTLQVRHRPENDSPNGIQQSQKDYMQNKKRPRCEMPEGTHQPSQSPQEEQLEQRPRRMSARRIKSPEKKP